MFYSGSVQLKKPRCLMLFSLQELASDVLSIQEAVIAISAEWQHGRRSTG